MNDSQVATTSFNSNYIQVKESQRGNPILQHIRNVQWEVNRGIVPDYVLGASTCALFITIKYHLLHPRYLDMRIREIGKAYRLRVVVCQVDTDDNMRALLELNKLCFSSSFTLILAWSALEAARYIETIKAFEHKPASSIQWRVEDDFLPKMTSVLKIIRSINRTDVVTLLEAFKNFRGLCEADEQQLVLCPGTCVCLV